MSDVDFLVVFVLHGDEGLRGDDVFRAVFLVAVFLAATVF